MGIKSRTGSKKRKLPLSSLAARRLIRAAKRKHKTLRAAARALRLPTAAQAERMLRGELRDTPAMRAALSRAAARAERAYYLVPPDSDADQAHLSAALTALYAALKELQQIAPQDKSS